MAIYKKLHKRKGIEFYYIRFQLANGRRKKERAGTTLNQARRLLKKREGEVTAGTYVDPKKKADRFSTMWNLFAGDHECRTDFYVERGAVLKAFFGDQPVNRFKRSDFADFARARATGAVEGFRAASPSTVKKELTAVGTFFRWLSRREIIAANPATDLDKPSEPKPKGRPLTVEQYQRLRDAAPPWLRPMLRLSVVTGLEPMDFTALQWDDIDWEQQAIFIERSKSAEPMAIPIGEVAREVLEGAGTRFRGGYVFTDSQGKPYSSKYQRNHISKTITGLLLKLGLRERGDGRRLKPGHSGKSLRRSAASWAVAAGYPEAQAACLLGHSRRNSMTARYIGLNPDDLRAMISALDRAEQGMAPHSAPQARSEVPGDEHESPNSQPQQHFPRVGT